MHSPWEVVIVISKIVYLAPDEEKLNQIKEALAIIHDDEIDVCQGYMDEGLALVKKMVNYGVEIIIARGGTASLIRNANLGIRVVDVPITGFDLIRAVEKAKDYGRTIAVVAFAQMVRDIDVIASFADISLRQYLLSQAKEAEPFVKQAFVEGADVVLGGFVTAKAAQKYNYPFVPITTSRETIIQTVATAKNLLAAIQQEKARTGFIHTVLDSAYEGIISVDQDLRFTSFNPVAQRLCKVPGKRLIGQPISSVWPELKLDTVVKTGKAQLEQLVRINNVQIICNKVPITVNGKVVGAVATLQEISKIQSMEAHIRQEIYARGHIARYNFDDILGKSSQISDTIKIAKNYARTESNVLICGETGSGKEVFAQSIHNASRRSGGPFVAINCAALPGQLLESELFGYVGGAFTGAKREGKPGLFEVAHKGTIFLDEISEIDYRNQGRLLRVLQERSVVRLGSDRVIPVDVRVIAASNKNLEKLIADHKFRDDLYFRLNVLRLRIPPLRERKKDIAVYMESFMAAHCQTGSKYSISKAALKLLENYSWPGNVRELMNIVERLLAVYEKTAITANMISELLEFKYTSKEQSPSEDGEISRIRKALTLAGGKYSAAAKTLGISRTTLWRKLRKYNLS